MNWCSFPANLPWFRSVTKWLMNTVCGGYKPPVQKDPLLTVQHWKVIFCRESNGCNVLSPELFKYYCEVFSRTVFSPFASLSLPSLLDTGCVGSRERSFTANGNIPTQGHLSRVSLPGRRRSLCLGSHSCQPRWGHHWLFAEPAEECQ